jgi:DNA repair ATPase RecN
MALLGVRQAIYTPPSNETFAVFGQRPHAAYLGLAAGLSEVRRHRTRTLRLDLLRYQIEEISATRLVTGEEDGLRAEREILANAQELIEAASASFARDARTVSSSSRASLLDVFSAPRRIWT